MEETRKTRTKKTEQFIREDDSGYKFVHESTSHSTDIEGSSRSGYCGAGENKWIETPTGDRIDSLEEAFEHIQTHVVSEFHRHEKNYTKK